MKKFIALALLALSMEAQASVICTGCEYRNNFAGTFLGAFNTTAADVATFQHSDVGENRFADFWVFDLTPDALGSMSADFTLLAGIGSFFAQLFADDGSRCGGNQCQSVVVGDLLAEARGDPFRWEILGFLPEGRYVLMIGGTPNPLNNGAYTGQMSFLALTVREAGTLGLMGMGLFVLGVVLTKWRRR